MISHQSAGMETYTQIDMGTIESEDLSECFFFMIDLIFPPSTVTKFVPPGTDAPLPSFFSECSLTGIPPAGMFQSRVSATLSQKKSRRSNTICLLNSGICFMYRKAPRQGHKCLHRRPGEHSHLMWIMTEHFHGLFPTVFHSFFHVLP